MWIHFSDPHFRYDPHPIEPGQTAFGSSEACFCGCTPLGLGDASLCDGHGCVCAGDDLIGFP